MKKIPTIFRRDIKNNFSRVNDEINPDAQWVFNGEGEATRKYDGTCALYRDGRWFWRHELKLGKVPPPAWEPAGEFDVNTGKQQGWIPVGDGPEDQYFRQAIDNGRPFNLNAFIEGTYELVGPKVQGGAELGGGNHQLVSHEFAERYKDCPRSFDELREWLDGKDIEGIVWHHPDGRMAKLKLKDFGFKRGLTSSKSAA